MDAIRTFVAIDVPRQIKMELDKLIGELRPFAPDIRWVKSANLHLTLRFLGDIPQTAVSGLASEIGMNISDFESFNLSLAGIGGFPNLHKPRVIWLGGGDGQDRLYELAPKIEKACIDCGFGNADKPFSSHLTIGRVKFPKGLESLVSYIQRLNYSSPIFPVEEVVIFKSDLLPSGPRYTRMESIRLK
jgi:RNA 2',3'-cyclic 3'-phosphodiesterase